MAKRKMALTWAGLTKTETGFAFRGCTAKGAEIECSFRLDDLLQIACAIRNLSSRAKEIIDSERQTHRWLRDRIAADWRGVDAAVKEEKPNGQ